MNSIDFIRMSLELSKNWIMGLAMDLQDAPLQQPTPNGGNHMLWCIGHLAYSEASMIQAMAFGKENPLAEWEALFNAGTTPSTDASVYPPTEEVLAKFEEVRSATLAALDGMTEADLDSPSKAEGEAAEWFPTVGACFAAVPMHFTYHGGQIADCRRAAGRKPLME